MGGSEQMPGHRRRCRRGARLLAACVRERSLQPQLRVCAEMNKDDGWSVPLAGAAHGQIKSIKQDKCLVPGTGTGPRSVKLGPCTTDVMKWRADAVDGRAGTCALRWPVTASKDVDQSGVPSSRVCYHSTGRSMGTWRDSVMFGSLDAHKTAGRLINNLVADAPSSTTDVQACAALCSDTAGCHSFNFHAAESSCELLQPATLADAPKADFSSEADGWAFYTADIVTVGTSCAQACLPQTVSRLQFPQVGGKFEDSSPDLLPLVAANRFDQVLFPEPEKDKPEDGASSVHEECMAEVDGVTIEVTSSCEAAKSVQCAPDPADGSKETCAEAKEAHCRRMVLLPITYFGPEKAQFRAKCGHGVNEDTKVWHAARIALDDCSTIVNFNDHCGSVQANI
eukprot:TRINITY_DN5279_c0_g1_i4.p1 TRINITY_DN5279_c0_g1~~TRINITY_DN5279_c0_g1_i4.p1  ORF type:complete len:396 (-),score=97.08 TRINITY_DN5279_c0_g1_i4:17-1204(-)